MCPQRPSSFASGPTQLVADRVTTEVSFFRISPPCPQVNGLLVMLWFGRTQKIDKRKYHTVKDTHRPDRRMTSAIMPLTTARPAIRFGNNQTLSRALPRFVDKTYSFSDAVAACHRVLDATTGSPDSRVHVCIGDWIITARLFWASLNDTLTTYPR